MCPFPDHNAFFPPCAFLVLPPLQQSLGHLVLLHNIHMRAPAGQRITIDGIQQRLGDCLEQVLGLEIGLPETFAGTEELVRGGDGDDEVFGEVDAAD